MIEILDKINCCGCYACANICPKNCIVMKKENEGFYYPFVDKEKCIGCGLCESACPITHKQNISINEDTMGYSYINRNDEIRKESTSGGAFYEIAKSVLDKGGIVYGAAFASDFSVCHIRVEHLHDLKKLLGSKYVQSRLDGIYKNVKSDLLKNKRVLFSGTPCHVEALKNFLNREYENLLCVDIICHGVPSEDVWLGYLEERKRKYRSNIQSVSFRNKKNGWKNYNMSIRFDNKKVYERVFYEDPYARSFVKDITLRPSCYDCKFKGIQRISDITLADYWGVWDLNRELYDDMGTSFIMAHTPKGKEVIQSVLEEVNECTIESAVRYNPSAIKTVGRPQNRDSFFEQIHTKNIVKLLETYSGITFIVKIKRIIKKMIGRK